MTEEGAQNVRVEVRNLLAAVLLRETKSVFDMMYPTVPERWGGGETPSEKLGLPMMRLEVRDQVYMELHRIAVRVVNPGADFTDDEIDEQIAEQELKERT